MNFTEDIQSVTDLKRHPREMLDHVHATGRPVVLTVNGRADAVILDATGYQKHLQAANLVRLLAPVETEAAEGRSCPARKFLTEFKRARQIQPQKIPLTLVPPPPGARLRPLGGRGGISCGAGGQTAHDNL